jgi:hypothetical protein
MRFSLQAVRVATGSDEEGMLVFDEDHRLTAVLTRLTDQHDGVAGHWFLETGFGWLDGPDHPTFADLDAAQEWISQRLTKRPRRPPS